LRGHFGVYYLCNLKWHKILYKTLDIDRYHKIPGDQCDGGFTPNGTRHTDIDKKCKAGNKTYTFEEETPDTLFHKSATTHRKVGTDIVILAVSDITVDAGSVLFWVISYLDYGSVIPITTTLLYRHL